MKNNSGSRPSSVRAGPRRSPGRRITGMPVSAGRVVARCCVVHGLEDAGRLEAGDVLVAPNTDPGWTPLFMGLGGLVLETGGALAHGAIIAREYGIPAVTAVANATRRIRDGEWVTLDGRAGTVQCHGEQPDQTKSQQTSKTPTGTNTQWPIQ
ncbi:hypothetical protein LCGC14_2019800 [marine sediment metagenome]|uniref:PEP-utilising enzyme mobile domain-containing protein n=1 Tax=marine sediment metagenome TaxID=412755 RepID=A0A0F9HB53_9ZZZZ